MSCDTYSYPIAVKIVAINDYSIQTDVDEFVLRHNQHLPIFSCPSFVLFQPHLYMYSILNLSLRHDPLLSVTWEHFCLNNVSFFKPYKNMWNWYALLAWCRYLISKWP